MTFLQWIRNTRRQPAMQGLVTYLVCQLVLPVGALMSQSASAAPITDPNAAVRFQPVIRDQNGVAVVEIVTPDSAGVSHNKYSDFDIASPGLVFNNSLVSGNSKLAGALLANPNFGGRSASTILNEITGASDSQLNGLAEIFGDSANLIIANPNGITCNGCGFLNTERLTLTTGSTTYNSAGFNFDVDGGEIKFTGEGLSYKYMPVSLDLLSRYALVDGEIILPGDLNIVAGRFVADYEKLLAGELNDAITVKTDAASSDRAVAIDGTLFGAMQAGKISMMATEEGLGVKADGYLFSHADDLFIQSAGGIELSDADAFGSIVVDAEGNVSVSDDLIANTAISIESENYTSEETTGLTSRQVSINADDEVSFKGDVTSLELDVNGRDVNSSASILAVNRARLAASESLTVEGADVETDYVELEATDIDIQGSTLQALTAELSASSTITLNDNAISGISQAVTAGGDIQSSGNLVETEQFNLEAGSEWQSEQDQIIALDFENTEDSDDGGSDNTVTATANSIALYGSFITSSDVSMTADAGTSAELATIVGNTVGMTADTLNLTNDTLLVGAESINLQSTSGTEFSGRVETTDFYSHSSGNTTFSGMLSAETIEAEQQLLVLRDAGLNSEALTVTATRVDAFNSGVSALEMAINSTLEIALTESVLEAGQLSATTQNYTQDQASGVVANTTTLNAVNVTNDGAFVIADTLAIDADNSIQGAGAYSSANNLLLSADNINIGGNVIAESYTATASSYTTTDASTTDVREMNLTSADVMLDGDLTASGITIAGVDKSGSLATHGSVAADSSITITNYDSITNHGELATIGVMQLSSDQLTNSSDASLYGTTLNITSEILNNLGLTSSEQLDLTAASMTNSGMFGLFEGSLNVSGELSNSGHLVQVVPGDELTADQTISLAAGSLSNNSGASLELLNGLLTTTGSISNQGLLVDLNTTSIPNESLGFSVNSGGTLTNSGSIQLSQSLSITDGDLVNAVNSTIYSNEFSLSGNQLTNNGELVAESALIDLSGKFDNNAKLWIRGFADIDAATLENTEEMFLGSTDLFVSGAASNDGDMVFSDRSANSAMDVLNFKNTGSLYFNNETTDFRFRTRFDNTGLIDSYSRDLNFISNSGNFYNGLRGVDNGSIKTNLVGNAGGNLSFSLGSGSLFNTHGRTSGATYYEDIQAFNYEKERRYNDLGQRITDRHRWQITYVFGDVVEYIDKSSIEVAGTLSVDSNKFSNESSIVRAKILDLDSDFQLRNYKQTVNVDYITYARTHNSGRANDRFPEIKNEFNSSNESVHQAITNELLDALHDKVDGNYFFDSTVVGIPDNFAQNSSSVTARDKIDVTPNSGLSIMSAGVLIGRQDNDFINEGSATVGSINYHQQSTAEGERGSFSNSAPTHVIDSADTAPTNAVNLLAFFAPETSFQALSDASVAGSKTPEQIAAQQELQAQLDQLASDNDAASGSIGAGHGSNIFDLDPDILSQIIADTEYELQPDYIFERIGEGQIPSENPTFFFDPYQEAQLLTQAAMEQTGTAYFSDDWDSSAEQRQALYDNTVVYLNENQDIELGTPLSEDVIADLNAPMMWYVSMDIGGEQQLVPTVYLPKATLDSITTPTAGSIVTDSMDVNVDEFSNSGNIDVAGVASIYAKSFENQKNVFTFGDDKNYGTVVSDGGNISAGVLAVTSENDITNTGGSLRSEGDMSLIAGGNINFNALELRSRSQAGGNVTENTDFVLSEISSGGDATFNAGGNLVSQAAQVDIAGNADINAENILLGGVVERDYEQTVKKKSGTFSSTKTTTTSETLTFVGSEFNIGGDANLTAANEIKLKGSNINADGNVDAYAENGITIEAGISQQTDTKLREDSNAARNATTDKGAITQTAVAAGISSGGSLTLDTNGDVNLLGSNLNSTGDMVIGDFDVLLDDNGNPVVNDHGQFVAADGSTVGNVNIGTVELVDESWSVRESSLKGPLQDLATGLAVVSSLTGTSTLLKGAGIDTDLTVATSEETRTTTTTHQGSELNAGGSLIMNADNDITIAGSQVNVGESAVIQADNVLVTAVENTTTTTHSKSEHTIDASDMDVSKDEITVAGFTDTQHTETTTTTQTTLGLAGINVGLNHVDENGNPAVDSEALLSIAASENIDILSSDVNVVGDAQLSGENITIGGLQETTTTTHEEETIVTSTTVGVKNAYVDAAYAADAVTKAAEDVERAERDLKDAEQRVKDGTLAESALDDYKANLAAATTQLGQATLNLAASGATAAGTTGTGGFYASATAETTKTTNSSTSTQSNFVGSNVNVTGNTAFSANKALNIIGAQANIGENLALDAEDITITAGENTYSEESSSSTQTASASMSTAPGSNVSGTLSTNDTQSSASGTTYTNSLLNAGSITSNSDTLTVAGASVVAQGDLDINANTVEVRSLQDTHQSSSNSSGGSVSGSELGVPSSVGYNESNSNSESAIVTQQTMLIGGASGEGDVNINADTMHIAGAVIASATQNEDGSFTDNHSQGTGSLNIVADTVTYEDIQDYSTSESSGKNANIGLTSSGTSTVGLQNSGHEMEQTTFATLGGGTFTDKSGEALNLEGVNTDLNNTQEVTKDMQTAGLDATVTVDHRLASEEGREAIRQDFEDTAQAVSYVAYAVSTTVELASLIIDSYQAGRVIEAEMQALEDSNPQVAEEVRELLVALGESNEEGQSLGPLALGALAVSPEAITAVTSLLVAAGLEVAEDDIRNMLGMDSIEPSRLENPVTDPSEFDSNSGGMGVADPDSLPYTSPVNDDGLNAILGSPAGTPDVNANSGGYQGEQVALDDLLVLSEDISTRKSGVPGDDFVPNPGIKEKYSRPSSAGPTAEQKASVQGKPCVDCGDVTPKQVADHIEPLVVQYYKDGEVNISDQRKIEAVQPHCPSCSNTQGGQLGAFGKKMKKDLGL